MGSTRILIVALIAFLAALAGVVVGRSVVAAPKQPAAELHNLLHDKLNLDTQQQVRLEQLERQFGLRKRALEMEMRGDNIRLAAAMEAEHAAGPRVREAVDRTHGAMGELQKETIAHIFAMRAILKPDQAAKFDKAVVKALTADAR
jgi:hypothetical protein